MPVLCQYYASIMPVLCQYYANVKCHLRPVVVLSEDCDIFKSICNLNEKMPNHAKNWLKGHKRSERHVMQPWTRHATDTAQTWCWQFSATLQPTFCVDQVASWHDCDGLNLLHSNPLCSNEVAILLCNKSHHTQWRQQIPLMILCLFSVEMWDVIEGELFQSVES